MTRIVKSTLMLVTLCVVALGSYSFWVIKNIPLEKISELKAPPAIDLSQGDSIDAGALVRKKDFRTYWGWNASDLDISERLKPLRNNEEVEEEGGAFYFKTELLLPRFLSNDCELVYCLQHRLNFPEIPSVLWRGLIGIEDYRFLSHKGVDPRSLARAFWHDLKALSLEQGGSTLTQQLVKNLFYTNEKTLSRKVKEMIASAYLENKLSKEEILQAYFNEVMWGSLQGIKIKGIFSASLFYFLKKPVSLRPYEASILIGLLKGPYFYSPIKHIDRLRGRADLVFSKLKDLDLFPEGARAWTDKDWKAWGKEIKKRNEGVNLRTLFYLSRKDNKKMNYENYALITESERVLKRLKEKHKDLDLAVKTQVYKVSKNKIEPKIKYYSKYERNTEEAFEVERHQVGSTLKPLIYFILTQNDVLLSQEVETAPVTLDLLSGKWTPRESHGGLPEKVSLKRALIESLNNPVVRSVKNFGFEKFQKGFKNLIPHLKTPLSEYPAQLLGAVELTMTELAKAYGEFLRQSCWQGESSEVMAALSDPTETTIRYRVGDKLGQMRFFGKTGTSNNGYDNWFVGFDGSQLHLTWVGHEGRRDLEKELNLFGSNSSFLVFKNYFRYRGKLFNEMVCQSP